MKYDHAHPWVETVTCCLVSSFPVAPLTKTPEDSGYEIAGATGIIIMSSSSSELSPDSDEISLANTDNSDEEDSIDFSEPWQFSDVVLVVEEQRFHVHRNILGMWSEVFTTMFTSQFKEKTAEEVPLPGKKSAEIKEMLLVIYPTTAKPIDRNNYDFLLDLAKEYMMAKLTRKCETFLMYDTKKPYGFPKNAPLVTFLDCLDLLDIAQNYGLERLQMACIKQAKDVSLKNLKNHQTYKNNKITFSKYRKIVEGRMKKLENKLSRCTCK